MAAINFTDFCETLCGLMGLEPPQLAPDASGATGFTITCEGTRINFLTGEYAGQAAMLMAVVFGEPPPGRELEVLRSLMNANFAMSGIVPPAFVRNPANGDISLHQSYLLSQVDVQSIYRGVTHAAKAVAQWRLNPMLDQTRQPTSPSDESSNAAGLA